MWDKLGADRQKTLIGGLVLLVAGSGVCWGLFGSTRGPSAEVIAQGKLLFEHQWTVNDGLARGGDGLGPVFNANSCVACHSQGGVGGGGGNERNVTAFEILPSRLDPNVQSGVIHSASTSPEFKETFEQVRLDHPIVPAGVTVIGNCTVRVDDFDPLLVTRINTPTLFGAGALDQISGSSIRHSHTSRRLKRRSRTV
ncbi:MAG: di-heme oxidoredictase family protein [Planctomycetaceae bacterium]